MKKTILILLLAISSLNLVQGQAEKTPFVLQKFTSKKLEQPINMMIAIIGGDDYSVAWLQKNSAALIKYRIPVFTWKMPRDQQQKLFEHFDKKMIIGKLSEENAKIFTKRGIREYPALYAKDGTVFQSKK